MKVISINLISTEWDNGIGAGMLRRSVTVERDSTTAVLTFDFGHGRESLRLRGAGSGEVEMFRQAADLLARVLAAPTTLEERS